MSKITREQVLENLNEVKKYIQEEENKKEEIVKGLEIKNRWTGETKFISTKTTHREACEDNKANLYGANLRGADLRGADLNGANLNGADLREADLRGADLNGANLYGADLYGADLNGANLYGADLYGADLMNAKFYGKGGTTKIKKEQIDDFFKALGIIVEN